MKEHLRIKEDRRFSSNVNLMIRHLMGLSELNMEGSFAFTGKAGCFNVIGGLIGRAYRGLTGEFLLLRIFSVAISASPHVCFI